MVEKEQQYYILFKNHTDGMELYHLLKAEGIKTIIAPTPRSLSSACGISLLIKNEDIHSIKVFIEKNELQILDIVTVE